MKRTLLGTLALSVIALSLVLPACMKPKPEGSTVQPTAQPVGQAVPVASANVTVETVTDDQGRTFQIQQGPRGEPSVLGCADGQREAFVDHAQFPNIAGCIASWEGAKSMRAPASGIACGDDGAACNVPADACAPGWHVCASDGRIAELRQVTGAQCEQAGGGRFSSGASHCLTQSGCEYDMSANANYSCFDSGWCSEPVCCGQDCGEFGACTGGVWENLTHIPLGQDQGCGASTSQRAGGILCCK